MLQSENEKGIFALGNALVYKFKAINKEAYFRQAIF